MFPYLFILFNENSDYIIGIGDETVSGFSLHQIQEILSTARRPVTVTFKCHKNWIRSNNGLPQYDKDLLRMMYDEYDENKEGLDADAFVELMKEIHDMAIAHTGHEANDLENAYNHAKDLIDSHDTNDDGRLDFDELTTWLDDQLTMGEEERKEYAQRGGHCPDSVRFMEDVAHGLHIIDEDSGEPITSVEKEPIVEEEEAVEDEVEDPEEEEELKYVKDESEAERNIKIAKAVAQREKEERERERAKEGEYLKNEIIPVRKSKLKAINLPTGCAEQVKKIVEESLSTSTRKKSISGENNVEDNAASFVHQYVRRVCLALSSGCGMKHLQISKKLVLCAVNTLLNSSDHVMRGAVVERCLNNLINPMELDDLDQDELLDGVYVHLNRERVKNLIISFKLENVDLQNDLVSECMKCHSEKNRFINLVHVLEAVAEPTEFEFMEMSGISRMIDDKHRYALMATVDRLSLTLNEERITVVNKAISESETWAQLAEVLEGIIAYKPNNDLLSAAVGSGLCCRNRPRLILLREHVRCSMMMPHGRETYNKVEGKLEAALTSYDLVDVLMLILNRYGETLVHLNESRNRTNISKMMSGNYSSNKNGYRIDNKNGNNNQINNSNKNNENRSSAVSEAYTGNTLTDEISSVQQELTGLKQAQRDEHSQLAQLMSGKLTADQFAKSIGRGLRKKNEDKGRQERNNIKPPPPPPGSPRKKKQAPPKPLKKLSSSVRASIAMMFDLIKDIESNPINMSSVMSSEALKVLNKVCVTIAGGAKLLLIVFHPRLSNTDKTNHLESAGLASVNTDIDTLLDGERRLLKSIVTLYMGKRTASNESNSAHRAVDSATCKLDVIEILHVMIISFVRMESIGKKKKTTASSITRSKLKSRGNGGKAAARGNNFFDGNNDKDNILRDGRVTTPANFNNIENKSTSLIPSSNDADKTDEWGEDGKEFDVMQSLPQDILFQPSPPAAKPPARRGSGKKIRVRGPKGLQNIKSLKKNRIPGPPSALHSYQGVQTMWDAEIKLT
jgi:hypothetical protein